MKKKAITLLLSLVLASGSIGNVQVLAAEATEQEAESVQETEETEITDDSEDALDGIVDSGSYGENITWTLTGSGSDLTLTLSGIIADEARYFSPFRIVQTFSSATMSKKVGFMSK